MSFINLFEISKICMTAMRRKIQEFHHNIILHNDNATSHRAQLKRETVEHPGKELLLQKVISQDKWYFPNKTPC